MDLRTRLEWKFGIEVRKQFEGELTAIFNGLTINVLMLASAERLRPQAILKLLSANIINIAFKRKKCWFKLFYHI